MPFKTCFFFSVLFLCVYINTAKRFENKILESIPGKPKPIWGWLLVTAGVIFSSLQFIALPFIFERKTPSGTIFLWFGCFGIFSIAALQIAYGLFKCIKEIKTQ